MTRLRISGPARADLRDLLAASRAMLGDDGEARYAATLAAAMRMIAAAPEGPNTKDRDDLLPGLRALHARRVRGLHGVRTPVHVIYFRLKAETIEVVRILHERMDPTMHVDRQAATARPAPRRRR